LTPYTEKIMLAINEYNNTVEKLDLTDIPMRSDLPANVLKNIVCSLPLAQFIQEYETVAPTEKRQRLDAVRRKPAPHRSMEDMGLSISEKPSRMISAN